MVVIRKAREKDYKEILRVQKEAFSEYVGVYPHTIWTEETLREIRKDAKEKTILVAEEGGSVVGSLRFWVVAGVCVIRLLSVDPGHQGKGIGKKLVKTVEEMAKEAHKFSLCTMLKTPRNINFFLSCGYTPEALMPRHYFKVDMICFAKYRR